MIKLIATDMDDTLLDEHSKIPESFSSILEKLIERKIRMVIASGRPYYTLKAAFGSRASELSYICDNGALVVHNNKIIHKSILNNKIVYEVIKESRVNKRNLVIVCALDSAYIESKEEEDFIFLKTYYTKLIVVDDLTKIDKEVNKVTICNEKDTLANLNDRIKPKFGEILHVVSSGNIWIDITNKGINKGIGMRKIMVADNLNREEVMAFGDYYNDIEMLKEVEYSFVMKNAPEDMKKYGNYMAETNKENGVLKAICKYVLEGQLGN